MANVTQTIPNLTQGISQQPDEYKVPGQVTDMINGLPDVTQGLQKDRWKVCGILFDNASSVSNATANGNGFIITVMKANNTGQVARNGEVKVWDCLTGAPKDIVNAIGNNTYLTHTADEDIQTLTLNDFTYINNRTETVRWILLLNLLMILVRKSL